MLSWGVCKEHSCLRRALSSAASHWKGAVKVEDKHCRYWHQRWPDDLQKSVCLKQSEVRLVRDSHPIPNGQKLVFDCGSCVFTVQRGTRRSQIIIMWSRDRIQCGYSCTSPCLPTKKKKKENSTQAQQILHLIKVNKIVGPQPFGPAKSQDA